VLSGKSGCAVVSVDYRLARAQVSDRVERRVGRLPFIATQGAGLGLDTTRLAVGGDSAGGTLAAVCAIWRATRGCRWRCRC
jgi:acetyl esterase